MTPRERDLLRENRALRLANEKLASTMAELVAANARLTEEVRALRGEVRAALGAGPHAPSGQTPPYLKPSVARVGKKPGRKDGHAGSWRSKPDRIDERVEHETKACPHCDAKVRAVRGADFRPVVRVRYVEDVLPGRPHVTEHAVHQYWCRKCRRRVEPAVTSALPGARLGMRAVVMTAVQHYFLGITIPKVVAMLKAEHGFSATEGGLVQSWGALAELLQKDHDEILEKCRGAAALHADETGWRVDGVASWLWCFCTKREALYLIDKSRGGDVAVLVLGEEFGGTLITDFYSAYNACHAKLTQYCLAHLLRDLEAKTGGMSEGAGDEVVRFRRRVIALFREAIRWSKERGRDPPGREAARWRFERRLVSLLEEPHQDPTVLRMVKRLWKSGTGLFTFVTQPDAAPTNNWAEINIRPAVIMRKNSYGNRSRAGADVQALLMSVFRTLKLRGEDVVEAAIRMAEARIVERHRAKLPAAASER